MPVSPYSGQIYSGYAVGRPFAGTLSSNYLTSSNSTTIGLGSSNDKSPLRSTSPGKPIFLSGNTAALTKTFSDSTGLSSDSSTPGKKYSGISGYTYGNRKDASESSSGTGNITGKNNNALDNAVEEKMQKYDTRPYVSKYGTYLRSEGDDRKPRPIDTSKINVSEKSPLYANTLEGTGRTVEDDKLISRNRQVVRLTIKREKDKDKKTIVLPENTVKTIAQKLFEKYTVPEKKKEDPLAHVPKSRLALHVNAAKLDTRRVPDKPPNLPIPPIARTSIPKESSKNVVLSALSVLRREKKGEDDDDDDDDDDDGNEGDDELSADESENGKDAATKCFVRATMDATISKELEDPEAVKDAIVAAILHPAVDIESDEEIKQLVNSESNEESRSNSKKGKKSKENKKVDPQLLAKRKKSDAEIGGEMIVDKLKRYVKHQVSIKRESLKNASRRASEDIDLELLETSKICKPKEKIIPISFQDGGASDSEGKDKHRPNASLDNATKTEKINSERITKTFMMRETNKNEGNKSNLSTSEMSLLLNEQKGTIKDNNEQTLNKSFKPVYQTTHGGECFSLCPKDHSITHPENKVPATSSFITNSVSGWNETGKESLSFQSNVAGAEGKMEEGKKHAKDLLKGSETKKLIINDYELNLGKKEGKNQDESQSQVNNSIKEESSDLKKKEKSKNIDSKESKLNYRKSKGQKLKEFKETQTESEKSYFGSESSVVHSKDDTRVAGEKTTESSSGEVKDKEGNIPEGRFNKDEIRDKKDDGGHLFQVKGMLINCEPDASRRKSGMESESTADKNGKNVENRQENELNLEEDFPLPKQVLAKSKRAFLKSLASKDFKENGNVNAEKTFDLRKSATTQIYHESPLDFNINCKVFNDAESLSSNGLPDLEIKPSLRQFLEEAKSDMKKEREKDSVNEKNSGTQKGLRLTADIAGKEDSAVKKDLITKEKPVDKQGLVADKDLAAKNLFVVGKEDLVSKKDLDDKKDLVDSKNLVERKDQVSKTTLVKNNLVSVEDPVNKKEVVNKKDLVTKKDIASEEASITEKDETLAKAPTDIPKGNLASKLEEGSKASETPKQPKKSDVSSIKTKPILIDELLNAKNVLKKPGKPKEELKTQPGKEKVVTIEPEPKKVWRKPPPPKTTGPVNQQPIDELAKACAALKRPIANKIPVVKQQQSSPEKKELQPKKDELRPRKDEPRAKKDDPQANKDGHQPKIEEWRPRKEGSQPNKGKTELKDDELQPQKGDLQVRKAEQLPLNERLVEKTTRESDKASQRLLQSPAEEDTPRIQTPEPVDKGSGSKKTGEERVPVSQKAEDSPPGKTPSGTSSSGELKVALSPSQSADSAYGSSPSTPQPRVTTEREGKRGNKGKCESGYAEEGQLAEEKGLDGDKEICEMCGTNCHKKCEKQMANLCGVNQKLLAEALSSVKKGSTTDGKDAFRILTAASTLKSASSVSSTEGETTTTDDEETETETDSSEYDGPAEIRPPIQTKPKYKKYNLEDFHFIKVLGKGSFGKVMLAQQVNTENYFAVKCLKKDVVLEDNDVDCCLIERKVLTLGTKHPYLCHLFCSFQTPSHLFFVMEYLTGGDLMFHIQHCGRFDEYRSCFYASEIISGLKFLHGKGIIYRDLKLDNILLDYEGHIRIADFGMCKLQIYLDRYADTFCGTPDYMAPEVIKGLHYNQCVDWWSFGVLMYEMMVGKSPFKGCDEDHLFWLICNEEPFYPRFLSREAQSLLKQLLDKDANRRLGPPYCPNGEIQCHQFFKYIDWNKIDHKEMEAPYKPMLRHILDVQYFDRCFTKKNAALTPVDDSILETMDQTPFKDFSYTNPNITD